MANTGFKGIDVRQSGTALLFRAFLTSSGAVQASGTCTLEIYELQSDGTLKSYDFNDSTFKTTALTTATLAMTHRQGNNSTTNTGVWTAALSVASSNGGFTIGAIYIAIVRNSSSTDTPVQAREFQFGSAEGDLKTTAGSTGEAAVQSDSIKIGGITQTARNLGALIIDEGTATAGGSTSITIQNAIGANSRIIGSIIEIVDGTGKGQTRGITNYTDSTKLVNVDRGWNTNPDNTSVYSIIAANQPALNGNGHAVADVRTWIGVAPNALTAGLVPATPSIVSRSSTIQSATGLSIVLDLSASATDQKYRYCWIYMLTGNAAGECDQIISYAGLSKTATLTKGWVNAPTTGDTFLISPFAPHAINWQSLFGATTSVNLSGTLISQNQTINGVMYANWTGSSNAATASTSNTVTVTSGLGSTNKFRGCKIVNATGANQGETHVIKSHTNLVVTIEGTWATNPSVADLMVILKDDAPIVNQTTRAVYSNLSEILGTTLTETVGGYLAASFKKFFDVVTPIFTTASTNQTGDVYAITNDATNGNAAIKTAVTTGNSQTTASAIRTAVGLNLANLDTQLASIASSSTDAAARTTASAIRAALGMAAADLDTQLGVLPDVEQIAETLFVDGTDNKLKVNADNSVSVPAASFNVSIAITPDVAQALQTPGLIPCISHTTLQFDPPLLGNIVGRTKLWITCKASLSDADSAALFQIEETAGLLVANGGSPSSSNLGSLTVSNETTGASQATLDESITALFAASKDRLHGAYWDIKVLVNGNTRRVASGRLYIIAGVTRANS